jgi:cleavage and polyadenylation specificity factor subunit 2
VKFQSLSGIGDESPHCYILQIDDFKFLLDCGWDERNSTKIIDNLRRHARQIDAILISHSDPLHLGCLPYAVGKLGINCPIYMTSPTCKMGQMAMYDLVQSKLAGEDFDLFNLDDVDAAFDRVIQLKHNQTENMRGDDYGLKILPVNAGHMIGGTAWKITKDEEEDFIYCVDVNHKREHHLNGFEIDRIQKPNLLITDGFNANYNQKRRRERDEDFCKTIQNTTTKNGGNVLIACDTAGRVLELALVLDSIFSSEKAGLENVNLVICSNVSQSTFDHAKNMIEWMSDRVIQKFTQKREQPYEFKNAKLCPDPKVVLATPVDMENGFSRDLFVHMSNHPKNMIILTSRTPPGTLSRKLIDSPSLTSIMLEMKKRINLQGADLDEFERQREAEKAEKAKLKQEEADSSDESDAEDSATRQAPHDIMISHETSNKEGGFFKKARKAFPMFPFQEDRMKWDDYGELISAEDYKQINQDNNDELSLTNIANKSNIQSMTMKNLNSVLDAKNIKIHEEEEEEEDEEEYIAPTKCIKTKEPVSVRCGIEFIDYEGRIDGESQTQLLNSIQPKEIIVVRSGLNIESYKRNLREKIASCQAVYSPRLNEIIDATKERHIYQIKLKDSLLSNLNFVKVGQKEIEVAWIRGRIDYLSGGLHPGVENGVENEDNDGPVLALPEATDNVTSEPNEGIILKTEKTEGFIFKEEPIDNTEQTDENDGEPIQKKRKIENQIIDYQNTIPTLELIQDQKNDSHDAVFVDEIKLSALKKTLIDNHIQAEFHGGELICNGTVAVKRKNGQISLEGALSEDYFKIRNLLYGHYAII